MRSVSKEYSKVLLGLLMSVLLVACSDTPDALLLSAKDYLAKSMAPVPDVAPAPGMYKDGRWNVDAPITINVAAAADPDRMAAAAKQGVQEHLDSVHRQASISTRQATVY